MSLRLLSGPTDIVDELGTPLPIGSIDDNTSNVFWYKDRGLLFQRLDTDTGKYYWSTIGLDGICNTVARGVQAISLGWWANSEQMLALVEANLPSLPIHTQLELVVEPRCLSGKKSSVYNIVPGPHVYYVRLFDRRIYFDSLTHRILGIPNFGSPTPVAEGPLTFPFFDGKLLVGRSRHEIFLVGSAPQSFCFYNTEIQTISPFMFLDIPAVSIMYAPEYNVIVSIHEGNQQSPPEIRTDYQLRVWALETLPTVITAPISITNLTQAGRIMTYQVQVLGSNGEPCVGERVNWSSTGAGTLLTQQSVTDDAGFALANIEYVFEDAGNIVLTATLLC